MAATRDEDVVELLIDQRNRIPKVFSDMESVHGDRKRDLFEGLVRLLDDHVDSQVGPHRPGRGWWGCGREEQGCAAAGSAVRRRPGAVLLLRSRA